MATRTVLDRRLRWSGSLIAIGLAIQLAASVGVHPLAFVAFVAFACPFMVAGMGLFLWTVASRPSQDEIPARARGQNPRA